MKRIDTTKLILAALFVLALFLRAYHVGTNPPALSWDEASIGYNAYSILRTGKDEHGVFLPHDTFAAFGDYKPPVPIYLTVPFVALLGMTEEAVRLPSVIAGALTVLVLYGVVAELFGRTKEANKLGLLSAGLLAVTPWHIMLSRAGFEANIALLFITTGIWWVLRARKKPAWLYVAWLPFVLGVYTFNSARYAGPLIAAGLLVFAWKDLRNVKKQFVTGVIVACIALLPIAPHLVSKQSRLRFQEVSIFTQLDVVLTANKRLTADGNTWWAKILDNRRVGYLHSYLVHFFDNVEPRFLFMTGDGNPKFSIRDTGELLLITAPFLIYGWLRLFTGVPAVGWFAVWWLVASIAPAAVARETPHALRVENGLPVYMLVTAYGFAAAFSAIKRSWLRMICIIVLAAAASGNVLYFWHNMTVHYPIEYSGEWQYGYKQAISFADSVAGEYDTIVLTESIGRPYIYALFYGRVSPEVFQQTKDASFDAAGFYNVYGFGTYRFVREDTGDYSGRTLFILPPDKVPKDAHVRKTIQLLNGNPVLVAFD